MKNYIIKSSGGNYYLNGEYTASREDAQRMTRAMAFAIARTTNLQVLVYRVKGYAPAAITDGGREEAGIQDTNNCVIRALSLAANIPYKHADQIGIDAGRQRGKGIYTGRVMRQAAAYHGITFVHNWKVGMSIKKFIKLNPTGRFVCRMSKHAFAVIDGVVHDTAQLGELCRIKESWQITSYGVQS